MCLIIQTDKPKQLSTRLLETAYENNSDGFGVMFVNTHTHRSTLNPTTTDYNAHLVDAQYKKLI